MDRRPVVMSVEGAYEGVFENFIWSNTVLLCTDGLSVYNSCLRFLSPMKVPLDSLELNQATYGFSKGV